MAMGTLIESQAAFLERHHLWQPGERRRVPDHALAPERPTTERVPRCPKDFQGV
jgi:hypothetical protein